jgi:hypothetical protein
MNEAGLSASFGSVYGVWNRSAGNIPFRDVCLGYLEASSGIHHPLYPSHVQEMMTDFDNEMRQREHEFNLRMDEMRAVVLSHELRVRNRCVCVYLPPGKTAE